jgi:hypothetical protein
MTIARLTLVRNPALADVLAIDYGRHLLNSSRRRSMKIALLLTGSGPLVIATSHASLTDSGLLEKIRAKGIDKFIAYELPLDLVKKRYAGHFDIAMQDLHESDDLRVVDFNGERAFRLFHLKELGTPVLYESGECA